MLSVENLSVSYGRAPAVHDVSFKVHPGEIVGIAGPNGAGKSTTLQTIAGTLRAASGKIVLDGKPLLSLSPEERAFANISLVPEGREIFSTLTVAENLLLAFRTGKSKGLASKAYDDVLEVFPILRDRHGQPAGQLSGGEQQQLAIARALLTSPKYLLVDEPSLGLAPMVVQKVYDLLLQLRKTQGLSILVVEQNMRRVLAVADRLYILREGATCAEFARDEFDEKPRLEAAYFGIS